MPRKIAIVYTGGTIGMTQAGPAGTAIPSLSGQQIAASVPDLDRRFELTHVEFGRYPGPHMSPERVVELRRVLDQVLESHDGVVVSHGTDTLEETAFLLDLFHEVEQPVVLVGAMRTMDELSWDGPVNLLGAALVASADEARNRGVMLVKNNTIHAASEVTKTHTGSLDAFVSPQCGPLGILDLERPIVYRSPIRRYRLNRKLLDRSPARVELLTAHSGSDDGLVAACCQIPVRGLVVQGMGRGNVPPAMFEALSRAMAGGVCVVVCSRCWGGRTAPVYAYPGGGATLQAAGAVFCPVLSGTKARLALSFLLAGEASVKDVHAFLN